MVINMKPVNHRVESPGYPMDGSSNFMSRLEQGDVCFRVFDLVQGFHQVPVHEDSRDLLMIRQVSFHLTPTGPGLLHRFLQFANRS